MSIEFILLDKQYIEENSKTALMLYGSKGKKYWLDILKADLSQLEGIRATKEGIEFDQRLLNCEPFIKVLNQLNKDQPFCSIHPELNSK